VEFFILMALMLGVFWFAVITPQRRRQNTLKQMVDNLQPGDYIVTAGGMYGTVTDVGDDDLGLEVAPDVEVRVAKRAVGAVIPPEEIEDIEVDDQGVPLEGDAAAQELAAANPELDTLDKERR
jgi:preprotein translocase subunit YajC